MKKGKGRNRQLKEGQTSDRKTSERIQDPISEPSTVNPIPEPADVVAPIRAPVRQAPAPDSCPRCGGVDIRIINSYSVEQDIWKEAEGRVSRTIQHVLRRRRFCRKCGNVYHTSEFLEGPMRKRRKGKTPQA